MDLLLIVNTIIVFRKISCFFHCRKHNFQHLVGSVRIETFGHRRRPSSPLRAPLTGATLGLSCCPFFLYLGPQERRQCFVSVTGERREWSHSPFERNTVDLVLLKCSSVRHRIRQAVDISESPRVSAIVSKSDRSIRLCVCFVSLRSAADLLSIFPQGNVAGRILRVCRFFFASQQQYTLILFGFWNAFERNNFVRNGLVNVPTLIQFITFLK